MQIFYLNLHVAFAQFSALLIAAVFSEARIFSGSANIWSFLQACTIPSSDCSCLSIHACTVPQTISWVPLFFRELIISLLIKLLVAS